MSEIQPKRKETVGTNIPNTIRQTKNVKHEQLGSKSHLPRACHRTLAVPGPSYQPSHQLQSHPCVFMSVRVHVCVHAHERVHICMGAPAMLSLGLTQRMKCELVSPECMCACVHMAHAYARVCVCACVNGDACMCMCACVYVCTQS